MSKAAVIGSLASVYTSCLRIRIISFLLSGVLSFSSIDFPILRMLC